MIPAHIPEAVDWIRTAEFKWGIYSEKAAKVRRYFLAIVEPDRFESVPIPQELSELGYAAHRA